jgi:anti-sigma factor RsiW
MNCSDWEERIALHAGGDLPPAEAAEVERHLRECAGCQVLASGLKQSLALLREAHDEPLAAAHFSAVRARVVAELGQERRPLWRRAWSYGLAAVAVALLVMLALRLGRTPERRAPVVAANHLLGNDQPNHRQPLSNVRGSESASEPRTSESGRGPNLLPPHGSVARREVRSNVPDPEPLIVKLQTDDPSVVIYWIADGKRGD